jgi:hypothetical protein
MSKRQVVSLHSCSTHDPETGLIVRLRKDQPFSADHPLVRARPHLFSDVQVVEQASAVPGEKRQVRRGTA